jgi:hypothetical protein
MINVRRTDISASPPGRGANDGYWCELCGARDLDKMSPDGVAETEPEHSSNVRAADNGLILRALDQMHVHDAATPQIGPGLRRHPQRRLIGRPLGAATLERPTSLANLGRADGLTGEDLALERLPHRLRHLRR